MMAVVAHTATRDKTDKVELEFWEINGDSGENSRTKVQNVGVDSTERQMADAHSLHMGPKSSGISGRTVTSYPIDL